MIGREETENKKKGKRGRGGDQEGRKDRKKRKYSYNLFKSILKRIILNTLLGGQIPFYFMNLYLLCIDVCAC